MRSSSVGLRFNVPDSEAPSQKLISIFREATALVREAGFRPVLFGGLAAIVRGRPRLTDDVDLILDGPPDRVDRLLTLLDLKGYVIPKNAALRASRDGMMQVKRDEVKVDFLLTADPLSAHVAAGATDDTFEGERIAIARAEDLIVMKLLAQRVQDLLDIQAMLVANRGRLDFDRVLRWVPELEAWKPGTTALFEKLKREFHDPLPPEPASNPDRA